jgi:YjbE family integral membrane protein
MDVTSASFWVALGTIVLANVVLSGDNAVVIAMAARSLPTRRQRRAIVWGSASAIVLRIALTVLAVQVLKWPWIKVGGAFVLLWIGVSLISDDGDAAPREPARTLGAAIRTILVADLVMSLDNVLAVAAAARGNTLLLAIGLTVSVPLIAFGSTLVIKAMARFPFIVTLGAAMLGWLAGEMLPTDPVFQARFGELPRWLAYAAGAVGAGFVVAVGAWRRRRAKVAPKTL